MSRNSVLQFPAAYVPLDPTSPPLCILRMMKKCSLNYCLVQTDLLHVGLVQQTVFTYCSYLHYCQTAFFIIIILLITVFLTNSNSRVHFPTYCQ